MKKLIFFIVGTLSFIFTMFDLMGQVPNRMNYQGVALNSSGIPIANSPINLLIEIKAGSTLLYREERLVNTDNFGHFNCQIGSAGYSSVLGTLNNITNNSSALNMTVYMDPAGGNSFILMGTDTLSAVPFSFVSKFASYADTLQLPFQTDNYDANSFVINNYNNSSLSNAIIGRAFGGNTNSVGVLGEVGFIAASGVGVRGKGYTPGSIAIEGTNLQGTGVRAKTGGSGTALVAENTNTSGKALDVNGNVKIAGGNTNPSQGAVLTSDASGNATWKAPLKVAFEARTTSWTWFVVPENTWYDLQLDYEMFDDGNDFNPSGSATDPATFIAPVSGVYNFSAYAEISISSTVNNLEEFELAFFKNGTQYIKYTSNSFNNSAFRSNSTISINNTIRLSAGDKLKVRVWQTNTGSLSGQLQNTYFTGHLVYAD